MLRRLTATVALAAAATVGVNAAATAYTPNPNPGEGLTLIVGGNVTFNSGGFAPGSNVFFKVVDKDGNVIAKLTLTADANGNINYNFKLNIAGSIAIVADGQASNGTPVQSGQVVDVVDQNAGGNTAAGAEVVQAAAKPVASTTAAVKVQAAPKTSAAASNKLANTGADQLGMQLWVGAGLLTAGAGLVGIGVLRRRQNSLG